MCLIGAETSLATISATAIEEELVARHTEAAWKLPLNFQTTPLYLKDFAAIIAMEMMMMLFAGNLITGRFSWKFNAHQPLIVQERTNIAIDSSDADALYKLLRITESFFRRKGSSSKEKR